MDTQIDKVGRVAWQKIVLLALRSFLSPQQHTQSPQCLGWPETFWRKHGHKPQISLTLYNILLRVSERWSVESMRRGWSTLCYCVCAVICAVSLNFKMCFACQVQWRKQQEEQRKFIVAAHKNIFKNIFTKYLI